MSTIGIIGSGIAGLAAGIRLRIQGHEVHIFEANDFPGGKLHRFKLDSYQFDAGPSLFTMPMFLDEIFTAAGKNPRDYYSFKRIDPGCHYFWEDGTVFHAPGDKSAFAKSAEKTFGIDSKKVLKYFNQSEELYDITEDVFLKNSLHKASTYLKWSTAKSFLQLYKARMFSTMHEVNKQRIGHPKLVQLFNRYATYNGSNPYRAPGTLTVIPTLEYRWGTFFPEGGMHRITESLYELACDLDVKFSFEEKVDRIIVENKRAIGLSTTAGEYRFDAVISNMDVVPTYRKLLKDEPAPENILNSERSSSALIFYWGLKGSFFELGLHNILWSGDYEEEFREIFEEKRVGTDPTVYINITSKHAPLDAPEGCENWFVMVNAPHLDGQDWEEMLIKTRRTVIEKINRVLKIDLERLIEEEKILDPSGIQSQTSSYLGSLYGSGSNNLMSAFLRHPNFSKSINNLYFCGGSVHPGGGIPLCLLSGKIVSELVG